MAKICFDYFRDCRVANDYNFVTRHDKGMKKVDAKLERITCRFLGLIARGVKEGFYYLIGKRYN